MKKSIFLAFFLGMFFVPTSFWAQTEPEDIAIDSDAFQDHFYEALKQKGIENYDKAIESLEKCIAIQPNNATLFFRVREKLLQPKKIQRRLR